MESRATLFGRKCANILPSPPISPPTNADPLAFGERSWYTTTQASPQVIPTPSASLSFSPTESPPRAYNEKISVLQENPPRHRGGPSYSTSLRPIITADKSKPVSSNITATDSAQPNLLRREDFQEARPARALNTASETDSELLLAEVEHQSDGEELSTGSEEELVASVSENPKSGTERLAEKRKMKRFRLTHAQTQYLTSEFSRQPHPDAAHRERLSQRIPGLNPRQVQVWFQNKRAKLKRLTTDDQERMRVSRALPTNFDFSQTLHPTSRELRPLHGSTSNDPLMLDGGASQGPSLRPGMGHVDTALNSISSSFTHHFPSPISAISSTDPSPVSSVNRPSQSLGPYFSSTQSHLATSSHLTNPLGRSHSLSSNFIVSHRQNQTFHPNGTLEQDCQRALMTSLSISPPANDTYGCGDLPPLQLGTAPLKTKDTPTLDKSQTTKEPTQVNGLGLSQYLESPVNSPNAFSCDHTRMLSRSDSALQASSYCQSQASSFWQGSQMNTQEYQYRQPSQPH